ncbi:MAG: VanZ family protein [Ginsengibacter sp.]
MQKIPIKKFLPGIAWFFIVLVLTCMPGRDVPKISWLDKIYFDKWVHAGMFGGLTFLFSWPFYYSGFTAQQRLFYFIKIALVASILGLIIEFIQKFYVTSRDFELLDWAADSVGAFLAFLVCRKVFIKSAS